MEAIVRYLFFLFFALIHPISYAATPQQYEDLDQFPFEEKSAYIKKTTRTEDAISNLLVLGMDTINYDVGKIFIKELNESLIHYRNNLPSGRINKELHTKIVREGIAKTIKKHITTKGLSELFNYVGSNIFRYYLENIFAPFPFMDKARSKVWIDKLLMPFEKCTSVSTNFKYQTIHCLNALAENTAVNTPKFFLYEFSIKSSGILSFTPDERIRFALDNLDKYNECASKIQSASRTCIEDTFASVSADIYYRKFNEALALYQVSTERKNRLFGTEWKKTYNCIQKISAGDPLNERTIQCLKPFIKNFENEIALDLIEKKYSSAGSVPRETQTEYTEKILPQFNECIEKSSASMANDDTFLFLANKLENMKQCMQTFSSAAVRQ